MKRSIPTTAEALKNLYEWREVLKADEPEKLYEREDFLRKWYFKTRIISVEDHYSLQVPLKDSETALAILNEEVSAIITEPREHYYVFNEDLSYKHSFEPKHNYGVSKRYMRMARYSFVGVVIILILLFFRFYKM